MLLRWAQALSPVGRCQTFDAAADGYGRGEAFAVVVLRPSDISTGPAEAGAGQPLGIIQVRVRRSSISHASLSLRPRIVALLSLLRAF
jgi:hypothetical protein